jgi:hypothetical protein
MARRIPTVGPRDVRTVQLSPRLRRIERRRTRNAAQREAAPQIHADKAALAETGKNYRTQVASIKGASQMTSSALAQALAGAGQGLHGRYEQQLKSELLSRLKGVGAQALPLIAEAGEERNKERTEAMQQLREDRAARDSSALAEFDQRLKELRGAGSSALKEQQEKRESEQEGGGPGGLSKSEIKALDSAAIAVKNFINDWKEQPELRKLNPLRTAEDWAKAASFIAHANESAAPADVATILKRVRSRWGNRRLQHQGKVPAGGIPEIPAAE